MKCWCACVPRASIAATSPTCSARIRTPPCRASPGGILPASRPRAKRSGALARSWDAIVDTTGRWLAPSIGALARGGRVVVMVSPGAGMEPVPLRDLYRREASIVGVNSLLYPAAECAELLRRLTPHFESGALRAPERIQLRPLGTEPYAAL